MNISKPTKTVAGMTPLEVAMEIKRCIELLRELVAGLDIASADKAHSIGLYDKDIGVATRSIIADGEKTTLVPTLAKSACFQSRKEMELFREIKADLLSKIEVTKTCLMGWQSIHKHFDHL